MVEEKVSVGTHVTGQRHVRLMQSLSKRLINASIMMGVHTDERRKRS